MTFTGRQVRDACELLRWTRYEMRRHTALPFIVIDAAMAAESAIGATLAHKIVIKDALHRAGIEFTPDGRARLRAEAP